MKFSVSRESLLEALQKVQSVVEKKGTVQILSYILCQVKDRTLSLSATDLEVGVKVTLPVDVEEEGKVTLSAKHFIDIVKALPNKPLKVTRKNNDWVEIICEKSRFNIVSLPADEYPELPGFEEKEYFEANVESLLNMINKTSFAVSNDATRYHINGVYLEPQDEKLMRMTATDGHRLSLVDSEVFLNMPKMKRGIILPKKGINELRKLLELGGDTIQLSFDRGHFYAHAQDTFLFVRLIDGEYPDYKQVLPKATPLTANMDKELFLSGLKRVALLAHEKSKGVRLSFKNNSVLITSNNPDMGEAREEIDIDFEGDETDISFNAKYLMDCLSVVSDEEVQLHFKDRMSPGVLRGKNGQNHTYVIMPMRI